MFVFTIIEHSLRCCRSFSIPITIRAILKHAGHQEENLPPPSKKVKADHGEIMQKISDVYTSRGHYLPYGSVNTSSTSYSKNIQTNKYSLCMRRFSGYKRSCFTALNQVNSLPISPTKPPVSTVPSIHPIPAQASDKTKISNTPTLSSLLDEKEAQLVDIKPPAHPLAFEPTQGTTPQQFPASILSDLLEGPEGLNTAALDKKPKKIRHKRRTSDGSSFSTTPPATTVVPVRKRKKSDNEEIVRELTSKVKSEVTEQQALATSVVISQPRISLSDCASAAGKPVTVRPPQADSHLVQLLHNTDDDKKTKPPSKHKVVTVGVSDFFESAHQMKQEALHAEVKGPTSVTIKTVRPKKRTDDKKVVKHSTSADSASLEKKIKRSDSVEMKLKDGSRSLDQMPLSPGKKSVKVAKTKAKALPKQELVAALTIKTLEDRASPKEKVKKQSSEKDKKKRAPKSPVATEPRQSAQDIVKLGLFYGNNSGIKSMPKIPKRKPGESQASPTSPKASLQQKSPGSFGEWQRASPVLNRSLPSKSTEEVTAGSVNRTKSFPPPGDPKRPALLPTPATPPIDRAAQRKSSASDAHKTSRPSSASGQPPKYSTVVGNKSRVDPSPNSPDELSIVQETHPVYIPTQPVKNNPTSPVHEAVTQMPKAIPLDPNKTATPKSILVKQKAVQRPLTFSPKQTGDRLDDDRMNFAVT